MCSLYVWECVCAYVYVCMCACGMCVMSDERDFYGVCAMFGMGNCAYVVL